MENSLKLLVGKEYMVTNAFTDYDGMVHEPGEIWIYEGTNFMPYDDGLTFYVSKADEKLAYRLQWRKEEQAEIIENFTKYVALYNPPAI